ncbi:TonB-dependent receptor domain-containing protein [Caulobacter segnis]
MSPCRPTMSTRATSASSRRLCRSTPRPASAAPSPRAKPWSASRPAAATPTTTPSPRRASTPRTSSTARWSTTRSATSSSARSRPSRTRIATCATTPTARRSTGPSRQSGGVDSWNNIQRSQPSIDGFSQEFRLASQDLGFGRVLAGLYYDHSKTGPGGFLFASTGRPSARPIPFGAYRQANNESYAAYARADFKLTDSTTLITGLRYNHDKIAYIYNLQYNTTPASNTTPFTRKGSIASTRWWATSPSSRTSARGRTSM